ncbi:hypothetical protein HY439_02005 [Candidatus Microgenomates bacterium]|nr:hypothetical protein [Candidatus Microgenomates bacterium]
MAECEPQGYQFKHEKRIHLDGYYGIARDLMELNDPIADGFMRTSDMRGDVVIVQKPRERVMDYDQVGFVRVAKFLQMPRLDFWRGNHVTETRKEDGGVWYIAINDQELADQVARLGNGDKKFDERFIDAFKVEVNRGLKACLKREKLLNSGHYNFGFFVAYQGTLSYDLVLFPAILAAKIAIGDIPAEALALSAGVTAMANTAWNAVNLVGAGMSYLENRLLGQRLYPNMKPDFDDPFVKHSILELVMPPVPVDRLFRGISYLDKHGNRIITPINF